MNRVIAFCRSPPESFRKRALLVCDGLQRYRRRSEEVHRVIAAHNHMKGRLPGAEAPGLVNFSLGEGCIE